MAFGIAEDSHSPAAQLDEVDFPIWREQLVKSAEDNGATVDVINLLKSLPRSRYETKDAVMRDFAEAGRRFATFNRPDDDGANRDRRNLGKDAIEHAPEGLVRHP